MYDSIRIRRAGETDLPRLREIYAYYVARTAVTFDYEVPSEEEMRRRMLETQRKYPYLVIEADGVVEGYAYAGVFKDRAAYDRSCELTIYLDHGARRRGLGNRLYEALEDALRERGMLNLYACIAVPAVPEEEEPYLTLDSVRFHAARGFAEVGRFHLCGYKFGRWYHMIWMEKMIGEHVLGSGTEKKGFTDGYHTDAASI